LWECEAPIEAENLALHSHAMVMGASSAVPVYTERPWSRGSSGRTLRTDRLSARGGLAHWSGSACPRSYI